MRSVFFPHLVNGPFGDPALYVRLAHRGEALLFDCGDLHPLSPRAALKIRSVFVSHAHIDHLGGFAGLLRLFLYQNAHLVFYGPPGIGERFAAQLAGYTWNLIESYPLVITVREWGEEMGREFTFAAGRAFRPEGPQPWSCRGGIMRQTPYYLVRAVPLEHGSIISLAFCLEEPLHVAVHKDALEQFGYRPGPWLTRFKDLLRQKATTALLAVPLAGGGTAELSVEVIAGRIAHTERGMKIVYVTDASPTPRNLERIAEIAADAHLLAIEAAFAHADLERARERNHLTARLAGSLGRKARAGRLLLFHHSPRYQDRPGLLQDEAMAAFGQPS